MKDLKEFSHKNLLYHFHRSSDYSLHVQPYLDQEYRVLFATRYPSRPNSIGISVVRLERIEGNRRYIMDVDMLDGTNLLDNKPHISKIGWLEKRVIKMPEVVSDGREG